jgi:hypothetical protein
MYTVPKLEDYSPELIERALEELLAAYRAEEQEVRAIAESSSADTAKKGQSFKRLRDRWLARKNGLLTQANELWLRPAPPEGKREAGRALNEARARLEKSIEDLEHQVNRKAYILHAGSGNI